MLINLRFAVKMKCVTCGLVVFNCLNYICLYKLCLKPCRDRCCGGGYWNLIKILPTLGVMIWTINEVRDLQGEWNYLLQAGIADHGRTRFDLYLIIYLAWNVIKYILRWPIFILFELLTCCCDKGDTDEVDINSENLESHIFHFNYVKHHTERLNNF